MPEVTGEVAEKEPSRTTCWVCEGSQHICIWLLGYGLNLVVYIFQKGIISLWLLYMK